MNHEIATASFFEFADGDAALPEWIQIIPAGPAIVARDGRRFVNDLPDDVIAAFAADEKLIPIDIEHATEIHAPKGEPAPAYGWVGELENRDGSIWGRVEWNMDGEFAILAKRYRYLSPAFTHLKSDKRVLQITSVALTNNPALKLKALFHNQPQPGRNSDMDLTALCRKLGLNESASMASIIAAVETLQGERETALNSANNPDLEQFVPRADHDKVVAERDEATTALASVRKEAQDTEIESVVAGAIKDGKIAPASKDYHIAQCRSDGGIDRFKTYIASAPKVIADTDPGEDMPGGDPVQLTDTQKAIASQTGLSNEEFAKSLA